MKKHNQLLELTIESEIWKNLYEMTDNYHSTVISKFDGPNRNLWLFNFSQSLKLELTIS